MAEQFAKNGLGASEAEALMKDRQPEPSNGEHNFPFPSTPAGKALKRFCRATQEIVRRPLAETHPMQVTSKWTEYYRAERSLINEIERLQKGR